MLFRKISLLPSFVLRVKIYSLNNSLNFLENHWKIVSHVGWI